ncbi:MAG: hypothetical protein ACYSXF_06595 [Planctomycetota bacterium]|jgi:hypothetical protein
MRVLLDNDECDMAVDSVGEAVAAGAALASDRGRTVTDVLVDGTRWSEDQLASPDIEQATAAEVQIITADPGELVTETFAEAAWVLSEAGKLQEEAAQLIQAGQPSDAMDKLRDAVSIWLSVQEAVAKGSQLARLDLDSVTMDGISARLCIERLTEQLRMIRSALQANDPVGLSDTLLYEMPEVVDEWRRLLEQLRGHVG